MPVDAGSRAPAFRLPGGDGRPYTLDHLTSEGPAVLAFFKTTCPTCDLAAPVLGELQARYGDRIPVVGVAQDPILEAQPWLAERGFGGVALDDSVDGYATSRAYQVQTVPTVVLVEADGTVGSVGEGWDRGYFNTLAADLGERTGRDGSPVSTPDDGRPDFKPG